MYGSNTVKVDNGNVSFQLALHQEIKNSPSSARTASHALQFDRSFSHADSLLI